VTKEHLLKMLFGLKEFIRDGNNRKTVQYAIDSLREEMDFDMSAIYELQLAIYVFQEAVGEILRQRHIQPHWMFALDNLLRSAVQCAITVISPELGAIIGDKTDLPPVHITEDEDSVSGPSTADSVPRPSVPVMAPVQRLDSSTANRTLYAQLKDLEDENRRLLLKLIDSQKVYQDVLRNAVQQRQQETDLLRASMSHPLSGHASCQLALNDMPLQNDTNGIESNESDPELVKWLTTLECDQDTINRLLAERFSKRQLLNSVTREDLRRANLKGGMFCRIWEVIQKHRQRPAHSPDPDI
jgi:mitogen-activated protein kinase kinase kinase 5